MEFNIQNNPNSSNPYDYCNNPGFRKIVAMGPAALKQIENYINRSSENGLTEYMLAIAAEEIAAVDLKKQPEKWINGKKWALNWNKFLRRLPSRVDSILADSDQESSKISKLEALGFAALPILEDKIREGNTSLLKPFHNILGKMKSESEELHRRAVKTDNIISTYRELLNRHK